MPFPQRADLPGPGAAASVQPAGPGGEAARVSGEQAAAALPLLALPGPGPCPPPPVAQEHAAGLVSPGDLAPCTGHVPHTGDRR